MGLRRQLTLASSAVCGLVIVTVLEVASLVHATAKRFLGFCAPTIYRC